MERDSLPLSVQSRALRCHVLTASGAALALAALFYAGNDRWTAMFVCLGLALIADASMARWRAASRWRSCCRAGRATCSTWWRFRHLCIRSGLCDRRRRPLAAGAGAACGIVIVVTGAIYFADRNMKDRDNYFRGFPTLWNAVRILPVRARACARLATAIVAVLAVMTFVPIKFVHPVRVVRLRALTIAALVLWAIWRSLRSRAISRPDHGSQAVSS